MVTVSIIIVSYNTRALLADCLASLPAGVGGLASETFVVDNGSQDGSPQMVRADFPDVRLIRNARNVGFAAANNQALRSANGRYVLLLNSDTRVHPGAIETMVHFMDAHREAGYCGPRLLNADASHQPSARRFPTLLSTAFTLLSLGHRFPHSPHTIDLHVMYGQRRPFRADWLSGACLMVRRAALRHVGPLDEGFFMYFEETDWCRTLAKHKWQGWYVPSAQVTHLGGASVGTTSDDRPFAGANPHYWIQSSRRYMRRHHGLHGMIASETIQLALYTLIWLRHRFRSAPESVLKTRSAAVALRLLTGQRPPRPSRAQRKETEHCPSFEPLKQ